MLCYFFLFLSSHNIIFRCHMLLRLLHFLSGGGVAVSWGGGAMTLHYMAIQGSRALMTHDLRFDTGQSLLQLLQSEGAN